MTNSQNDITSDILKIIFRRRKLLEFKSGSLDKLNFADLSEAEIRPHLNKIEQMVKRLKPIHMILPAYPGKSPNRDKTLGKLPDLSEKHSIDNLAQICREINEIYAPGAKICIASDGYVFADLVRIPDSDVFAYTEAVKAYYKCRFADYFEFFDIKDAMAQLTCLDAMREEMMIRFGESLISLTAKTKTEKETRSMYQGITRFMFEDFCGLNEFAGLSKTQIQKQAKQVALRVIQRSNAWSLLLEAQFPASLRLSIHPQFRVSGKIGIHMADTDDCWRTPWHSVAVMEDQQIRLHKRNSIDENRHRLIFVDGQPCHYKEVPYQTRSRLNA